MMGDFKPSENLKRRLPSAVLLGIENHRLVDRQTDRFQAVKDLKSLFSPERRRYAGVITDIAFDYFLIKHWRKFAKMELELFTELAYQGLAECQSLMPPRMQSVTTNMIEHKWLQSYATINGIGITIDHVSRRIRFKNKMTGGVEEVQNNYEQIEVVFLALFEHLQSVVRQAAIETLNPNELAQNIQK